MIKYKKGYLSKILNKNRISFQYSTKTKTEMIDGKKVKTKRIKTENIMCFDIETSVAYIDDSGSVIPYFKGMSDDFIEKHESISFSYIWQFSIDNAVIYGRELYEFMDLISELRKIVIGDIKIYVHNLSYEFQYLLNLKEPENLFVSDRRKIYSFQWFSNNTKSVFFSCSYMLTRYSLDAWGKEINAPVKKLVGNLDYNKIRTPLTKLTDKEFEYCENDLLVMYYGLKKYVEKYGSYWDIPLTQTGEVRREVKALYKKDKKMLRHFKNCLPKNADEYLYLKNVFAGGDCHANFLYVSKNENPKIITNVHSFDISSSYPFALFACKFPAENFKEVPVYTKIEDIENNAYIIHLKIEDLKAKKYIHTISSSKIFNQKGNIRLDNGRVIECEQLEIILTEYDFKTLLEAYTFKKCKIVRLFKAKKEYLNRKFVEYILELYEKKTTLKGLDDFIEIYQKYKKYINALFGMTVYDIVQNEVIFDINKENVWEVIKCKNDSGKINEVLEDLKKEGNEWKNYQVYSTGVWCCAIARRRLNEILLKINEDVVYYDTDSCKFINYDKHKHLFNDANIEAFKKLKNVCDHYNFDINRAIPKNKKGKLCPLGFWDYEGEYSKFATWGAKRYAYEKYEVKETKYTKTKYETKELQLVVSGLPKKAAMSLNSIEDFKENMIFDKDVSYKKCAVYNDGNQKMITINRGQYDEWENWQEWGICLRPTSYSLTLSKDFSELVKDKNGYFNYLVELYSSKM